MISITEAITRLGVSEEFIRLSLEASHPEDYDTIEYISLLEFEVIAKTLESHATGKAISSADNNQIALQGQQDLATKTSEVIEIFDVGDALDLTRLNTVLAFISAKKHAADYTTVYTETFSSELRQHQEQLKSSMLTTIHAINNFSSSDFLTEQGIALLTPKPTRKYSDEALQILKASLPN